MENQTRQPAVAGLFYPENEKELRNEIQNMLSQSQYKNYPVKAIIAPHAGYVYSGPIAASAYKQIEKQKDKIKRVVLLGPSHRVYIEGLAYPKTNFFQTPLGTIPIDQQSLKKLTDFPFVTQNEKAHFLEHSLEVQIPFLQHILNSFTLIPLVVGNASALQVANVLEKLWGNEDTLIVISSDLSHYHPYQEAQTLDKHTCQQILAGEYATLDGEMACGYLPIQGLLAVIKEKNLSLDLLDLRNSGDTSGDKQHVVGYAAFIAH